ncbi:hypothetical protein [Gordonia polyisoprenivorans]|uniref:hypothetical protein n=1 Tax=Gordonia polyisoprenivorans TaxID=84595 RepID=UPI002301C261|nr:hypothetical protein [Gordonia polyisoprenivorans]WCB36921.1 hypothetical protein PHA63_23170 [Gordonia polyisoprenivorans]
MGSPRRVSPHAMVSRGLQDLDAIMPADQGERRQPDELVAIVAALHQIESSTRVPVVDLLLALTDAVSTNPAWAPSRAMSADQEAVLLAAGSFVDEMPLAAERASTTALRRIGTLLASALSTDDAAARLGVTAGWVRQRLSHRTLLSVKVGTAHRLPVFQFAGDGELPGWGRVAPAFPITAHPIAVAWFMQNPHPDLSAAGESMAPSDWLSGGGDSERVIDLIATAFVVHAS